MSQPTNTKSPDVRRTTDDVANTPLPGDRININGGVCVFMVETMHTPDDDTGCCASTEYWKELCGRVSHANIIPRSEV